MSKMVFTVAHVWRADSYATNKTLINMKNKTKNKYSKN